MKLKSALISLIIFLLAALPASAQYGNGNVQAVQFALQAVQSRYQTAASMYDIAQMSGNAQQMQLAQFEAQYCEQMYNVLTQALQNPHQLNNPQVMNALQAQILEFDYRTKYRDYRSYQEIQPQLQAHIGQRQWMANTAEGRAFHQQNHAAQQAQFDNYMNGLQAASDQQYRDHRQFVNGIHDQQVWVNPQTGNEYTTGYSQTPYYQNADGTWTEMTPLHQYR